MKTYRAEFADDEIEVFHADNDDEARLEAWELESQHGTLFTLHELDDDYNEIKSVF